MNPHTPPQTFDVIITNAPIRVLPRKRVWIEDNGTETFLCEGCGEWQAWFEGDRCPVCVECAAREDEWDGMCQSCHTILVKSEGDLCPSCEVDRVMYLHD